MPVNGRTGGFFVPRPPKVTNEGNWIPMSNGKRRKSVSRRYSDGTATVKVGREVVKQLDGKEDFSQWTTEELLRGARMDVTDLHLPHVIPIMAHQELARRVVSKAQHRFVAELEYAIGKHMEIIKAMDPDEPTSVQWAAIKEIEDRVLGKATERHEVTMDAPFVEAFAAAIVGSMEQAEEADTIIDVEAVDDGTESGSSDHTD